MDQTGITGKYDLDLRWTTEDLQPNEVLPKAKDQSNALPGLYAAIQEQLGLKLKPVKAPAEVLVVESVEMPTED